MHKTLLLAALLLAPHFSQAATISVDSQKYLLGPYKSEGFTIAFRFDPISVPGKITSFTLDFSGYVNPRLGGAYIDITKGDIINSINVRPEVYFSEPTIAVPLVIDFYTFNDVIGPVVNEAYDNVNNISIVPNPVSLTMSGTAPQGDYNSVFAISTLAWVSMRTRFGESYIDAPPGSQAFFFSSSDRTDGDGSLRLTVTYDQTSVPETTSLALLGVGLLGATALYRRRDC